MTPHILPSLVNYSMFMAFILKKIHHGTILNIVSWFSWSVYGGNDKMWNKEPVPEWKGI